VKILEIIVLDVSDVIEAQAGGATSLEVIQNLAVGGLTPDFEPLKAIRDAARVHLNVIIRPHARDFVYTPSEIETILRDTEQAVRIGADGIVFGALTSEKEVDVDLFRRVTDLCRSVKPDIKMTFHRAIEEVRHPEAAFEALKGIADRILCSGLVTIATAWDEGHRDLLRQWVQQYGADFHFACGGGVNLDNLPGIIRHTHTLEYHVGSGARVDGKVERLKVAALCEVLQGSNLRSD
jgi:copper homeostasis protein